MKLSDADKENAIERRNGIRATPKGPKREVMKEINQLIGKTHYLQHLAKEHNDKFE